MQIAIRSRDLYFHIAQPAKPGGNARRIVGQHSRIADQNNIAGQFFTVLLHEPFQALGTHFFFTFDHEFDVTRQFTRFHQGFKSLHLHIHLTLVIAGTAGENGSLRVQVRLLDDRFKGRRLPKIIGIARLNVVMPIDQDRWKTFADKFFSVNNRVARRFANFRAVHTRFNEAIANGFCTLQYVSGERGIRANAGNSEQVKQLIEEAVFVFFDV